TGDQPQLVQFQQSQCRQRRLQMAVMNRVEHASHHPDAGRMVGCCQLCAHWRVWPSPRTMYFCEVSPSSPTGPRACSLSVEMPISAPSPYSKPSAKRVEALTTTELESTSRRKRCA